MRPTQPNSSRAIVEQEVLPHLDALFAYSLYLTRNRTDAEELTQETLLKAVSSISQYQRGTNCKAWLFRIMHNTFLNSIRRKPSHVTFDDSSMMQSSDRDEESGSDSTSRNPEGSFVSMLSRSKVREAVEKLPPEFRSVVVLADLEEFSYKEIAEILSCPMGTVMSRLFRGRRLLRSALLSWARELGIVADERETGEAASLDENVTHIAAFRRTDGDGKRSNGEESR